MKKLIALSLAGALVFSTPVMAAQSVTTGAVSPSASETTASSSVGSSAGDLLVTPTTAPVVSTPVATVTASAIPASVAAAAADQGKSVGEYMNNAVTSVPGLTSVTPVGQGGHVIINGAPSNQVFSVLKPTLANVNSAKAHAAALGGKVLNVAQIKASVNFNTATVNFYMPGIKAGQNIKVYQLTAGAWSELTVKEIRADHVVVDMTSLGTLAFVEVPVQ